LNCPHPQSGLAGRGNNGYLTVDEVRRESRQSIVLSIRPPVLDRHVPSFDIALSIQSPAKRRQHVGIGFGIPAAEPADHRHRRLLRPRRHRPRRRRAAEPRDEFPAVLPHICENGWDRSRASGNRSSRCGPRSSLIPAGFAGKLRYRIALHPYFRTSAPRCPASDRAVARGPLVAMPPPRPAPL
jgi:hypothetical protein